MGIFKDIFLSKEEKKVVDVYNNIRNYWKNTNDFVVAHIRYLQDLNYRYKLDFYQDVIEGLPYVLLTPLISKGFSQSNSMFIFSQFVVFYILRNDNPSMYRLSDENLSGIAENIEKFLIPYNSKVTPEFAFQINKNIDFKSIIGNRNISNKFPLQNEENKQSSERKLAIRIGCTTDVLEEKVFKQLESMGVNSEVVNEVNAKHEKAKYEQAKQYNMHPDDTPAGILLELSQKYIESLKPKEKTHEEIISEMSSINPDLTAKVLHALAIGDMDRYSELIHQNPDYLYEFLKRIAEHDESKEKNKREESFDFDNDLPF